MSLQKPACLLGFYLVFFVALDFSKQASAINFSPECVYKGYVPGLFVKVRRTEAVKPEEFEKSVLQQGLEYFNTGSGVTTATLGVIDAIGDVMKAAPQLTAAIGILSVGMSFLQSSPSPQDILDKAYESIKLLSDEVNVMMDEMEDYVDAKFLEAEKSVMEKSFKTLSLRWFNCLKEVTVEDVNSCQMHAVNEMSISIGDFLQLNDKFRKQIWSDGSHKQYYSSSFDYRASAGTWQWMNNHCGSETMGCLSYDDVKRIEVGILVFRDYASLHLFALKAVEASLRPIKTKPYGCKVYKRYVNEMRERAEHYIDYANWAKEWSYIRQYEEDDYFGVPNRAVGRRANSVGGFLDTFKCSGGKCSMECTQMFKSNACTASGGSVDTLKKELELKCNHYLSEVKKGHNEFWSSKVMDTAEEWMKYYKDADATLKSIKCVY